MDDDSWIEEVCRGICRTKGVDPESWIDERPAVLEIMSAMKSVGAVVVPIVGEVE